MDEPFPIKILIVDDNRSTLVLLKRMLEVEGLDAIMASSGEEALEIIDQHDFALILMDVMMTGKNGMETAEQIRALNDKSHIPIIFITGIDRDMSWEFKGYEIGAVDFIYKPVNPMVLKSKIRVFTDLYIRGKRLEMANAELHDTLKELRKEMTIREKTEEELRSSEGKFKILYETSRDMEAQLRQAQKMEAVGSLAGGIAHDFNNILAAIMGYIELAQFDIPEDNPARYSLNKVLKATHRAMKLVRHILAFSRKGINERRPVYLQHVIAESIELIRATIPSTITIRQSICMELKSVNADPTQIHQVVMNLCTNAYHAMEGGGGNIDIHLRPCVISEEDCRTLIGLRPGEHMCLEIEDTGCGMAPDMLSRIFDPFFTTKPQGKGTGLGLSVVDGIVKSHEGALSVKSVVGKGSMFSLYFPVVDMKVDSVVEGTEVLARGNERILFVDDEENLTDVGSKMLQRLGYRVVSETSSLRALERFKEDPQGFDLLVTDMTMPDLTGIQLARKIKMLSPRMPVVLCTGYHKDINMMKIKSMGIDQLVLKPLKIVDLAKVIRQVMDSKVDERICSHG